MAHFNPAVTIGFLITRHLRKNQLLYYLGAEIVGALLGSLFVNYVIGNEANLGANAPNYSYPLPVIFGIEVTSISTFNGSYIRSCSYERIDEVSVA